MYICNMCLHIVWSNRTVLRLGSRDEGMRMRTRRKNMAVEKK